MTLLDSETRGRMAEADHRIANNLAMLGGYVRLKGANLVRGGMPLDAAEVALVLRSIGVQIVAISELHRALSAGGTREGSDIAAQLSAVCSAMRSLMPGEIDIVESIDSDCTLAADQILPVTQICSELITNAIKHGRSPDGRARIRVSCNVTPFGEVQIQVADQGQGRPTADPAPTRQCLGSRLIDSLAQQSSTAIAYLSTPQGLTARLTVSGAPVLVTTKVPRVTTGPNGSIVREFYSTVDVT